MKKGDKGKKRKHYNSHIYWNLQSFKAGIDHLKSKILLMELLTEEEIKRTSNGKSFLTFIQEKLIEKYSETLQNKESNYHLIEKILDEINILQMEVYYIVENMSFFIEPYIETIEGIDPSGIIIDKIKEKIKAAVERFNGKWTSFEKRIKTDIRREIKKAEKIKCYHFSSLCEYEGDEDKYNNSFENRGSKQLDFSGVNFDWSFLYESSPEDVLLAKEAEGGIFLIGS